MEPDSWDELFDELYLEMYASRLLRSDPRSEALGAVELAGVPPGGEILDAPCGFGRHSIPLAQAGFRVTGADRSGVQLDEARRAADDPENPRWVQADFRELPFDAESFDAVFNLFSSLGYRGEEGDLQTLREFRRVLRPGGALAIETMHRDRLVHLHDPETWEEVADGALILEKRQFDYLRGEVVTRVELVRADGERRGTTWTMRLYSATELAALLREAGFGEVEAYGGLDGAELAPEKRLALVARP
jgi:ubiquinone/menaquinone biosynthesis C-methylase UbiE